MKRQIIPLLLIAASLYAGPSAVNSGKPVSIKEVGESITLEGNVAGTVQFTLYDLKGRRLHRARQVISAGLNSLKIPKGISNNQVVLMEISDGKWKYTEQLVLQ